jgi:exonuclease SbcC
MRRDDQHFAHHLVHEGAQEASLEIVTRENRVIDSGIYKIANGAMSGEPFLNSRDSKFFGERCYLAQSMLGRLLEIYQNSSVEDGESALTQFVKDLLGLNQLDALVEGLEPAGDRRRTRNLVPELRSFEERIKRVDDDASQLNEELVELNAQRGPEFEELQNMYRILIGEDAGVESSLPSIGKRLQGLPVDSELLDTTRRRTELQSIAKSWSSLPQGADANVRKEVEVDEDVARSAADEWRKSAGAQIEEVIVALRNVFPDLASWSSTSP